MRKEISFLEKFLYLINWTFLVLILLTIPMSGGGVEHITFIDKIVHFFMFGIFSYLIIFTFVNRINKHLLHVLAIFLGIGYALVGEYLQSFIPSRDVSEADFLAGVVGVICFVAIASRGGK